MAERSPPPGSLPAPVLGPSLGVGMRTTVVLVLVAVLAACSLPPPAPPTPSPTPTRVPTATPTPAPTATPIPLGTGPLRASGSKIVDAGGREVRLTGVNWSGTETGAFAPIGLETRKLDDMLDQMVAAGFNTLRLPYSNQLLDPTSRPTNIDLKLHPDLQGLNGLGLMDRIVEGAGQRGLRVILDRHRPTADGQSELWYWTASPRCAGSRIGSCSRSTTATTRLSSGQT